MSKRLFFPTASRLALAAAFGAALLFPSLAQAADKLTVQTDWSPFGAHAGLFLAAQKGWFKDAGLDVTLLDGKGSATTIQQVGAGQLDVGFAQLATMATAIDKGMKVISIACYVRAGDNGVMMPVNGNIKTAKDLIGKRIVYASGSASASLLDAFFEKAGLKRSQMTLIGVDSSALPGTYIAGRADAAITTFAYFGPVIASKRPSNSISYSAVGIRVPSYGLVVRKDELTAKADILRRFVPVTIHAWNYIFAGHVDEAIAAIVAQRPNDRLDTKVMTGQLKNYMTLFNTPATKGKPIGWQSASDWKEAIADLKAADLIHNKTLKPADFYTNQFIPQN
mgnify:CR=1 FL=1